jgi:hypothetical protein
MAYPEVMTTTELKKFLRINYDRAKKLLEDGIIPNVIINDRGDRRVLKEDAMAYIRSGKS